ILADGQTAICTSHDPFVTWECGRRIEQRLDGPTWIVRRAHGRVRSFVFARKHLPCTFKRTAIYELRGDLTDPGAAIEVCEIQELKSSGDTAYTSLAPPAPARARLLAVGPCWPGTAAQSIRSCRGSRAFPRRAISGSPTSISD